MSSCRDGKLSTCRDVGLSRCGVVEMSRENVEPFARGLKSILEITFHSQLLFPYVVVRSATQHPNF